MSASTGTLSSPVSILLRESHAVLRERVFTIDRQSVLSDLDSILALLRAERATGKLIINLSQGSVGTIQFEESRRI